MKKVKKGWAVLVLLIIVLIGVIGYAQAIPQVTSVNEDLINGNSVTLSGVGFGEKQYALFYGGFYFDGRVLRDSFLGEYRFEERREIGGFIGSIKKKLSKSRPIQLIIAVREGKNAT